MGPAWLQVNEVPELRRQLEAQAAEAASARSEAAALKGRFLAEREHRRSLHEHLQARPALSLTPCALRSHTHKRYAYVCLTMCISDAVARSSDTRTGQQQHSGSASNFVQCML